MHEDKVIVRKGGTGSLLSGFLLGGLIGAGIALLNAPRPGTETRQILRERGMEIKDQVVDTADKTRNRAEKVISNARGKVSDVAETARGKVADVAGTARERAADLLHREASMLDEGSKKMHDLAEDTSRMGGGSI